MSNAIPTVDYETAVNVYRKLVREEGRPPKQYFLPGCAYVQGSVSARAFRLATRK